MLFEIFKSGQHELIVTERTLWICSVGVQWLGCVCVAFRQGMCGAKGRIFSLSHGIELAVSEPNSSWFAHHARSPLFQDGTQEELCKVALTCHFAFDVLF